MDLRTAELYANNTSQYNFRNQRKSTHILVNLDADPPAIFCTRRVSSSFFNSRSCLDKSFFDLETRINMRSSLPTPLFLHALGLEFVGLDFCHFGGIYITESKLVSISSTCRISPGNDKVHPSRENVIQQEIYQ